MKKSWFKGEDTITVGSPLSGKVVPLETVSDRAFAEKMMGEGVALVPSGGELFSPVNGAVETIAETAHAVGLRSDEGVELLIHLGLETVNLKGQHFTSCVAEGDRIKTGDVLIRFDLAAIQDAGYDTITPVTVVNSGDYASVLPADSDQVMPGEPLLLLKEKKR